VESQGGIWVFQHFVFENSSMMGVGLVVKQKKTAKFRNEPTGSILLLAQHLNE